MLLIMTILLSVSFSLSVVEKDTVKYTVVTVLGGSIELDLEINKVSVIDSLSGVSIGLNSMCEFRGPPNL